MNIDFIQAIGLAADGCTCSTTRLENGWSFAFLGDGANGCGLFVTAPWRIICGNQIAHAVDDDGQWFGLSQPVDGEARANGLLQDRRVTSFTVDPITADLRIAFDAGTRLDVFTNSAGYESWNVSFGTANADVTLICGGGGNLSFVSTPKGSKPKVVFGQPIPKQAV